MKSSVNCPFISVLFFLLTLALVLFSWIGSIYGWGEVQSLLSADGIRWALGHVMENYVQCTALGLVLVLLMGVGVGVKGGLYDALRRLFKRGKLLSRKERRALNLALIVWVVYVLLVVAMFLLPWNFLLGVTGSWFHSPFAKGFVYILSLGIGCSGMVYGYVSDTYHRIEDVVMGMSCLVARSAPYFVTLFFVVQFFSCLKYSHLAEWMGMNSKIISVFYQLCCYFPLMLLWFSHRKQ